MSVLLALLAIPVAVCLLYTCYRRPDIALALMLAAETFLVAFGPNAAVVGGLHLTPSDAVAFLLMSAGAMRSIRDFRTINLNRAAILCFLLLLAFSVLRGVMSFGIATAGNEARTYVGSLAGMLYFATVPTDEGAIRRYMWIYFGFGLALCGVAAASAAGLPVGLVYWNAENAQFINGRYLPSTGGAALAVCGYLSLAAFQYHKRTWWMSLLVVVFLGSAIYLRHRTVWIMLLAGAVALVPLDLKLLRRLLPFAGLAVVAVSVVAVYNIGSQGQSGKAQFEDAATNDQTFLWRLNGWLDLLDDEQTPLTVVAGKSMGTGFWRIDPTTYETLTVAPHSEYLSIYLRFGVIGLLMLLLFAIRPVIRMWRYKEYRTALYPSTTAWAVVILISLVYGVTYGIDPHLYALIGIGNAMTMHTNQAPQLSVGEVHEWDVTVSGSAVGEGA